MARIIDNSAAEITGILDWDRMIITPAIVAFQPSWWQWMYDRYCVRDEDSWHILVVEYYAAVGKEEKKIRHGFEAEVGEEVSKHTRHPKSDIANWLWKWAQYGVLVDSGIWLMRWRRSGWLAGQMTMVRMIMSLVVKVMRARGKGVMAMRASYLIP
jgi:hypothetical protein